MFSLLLLHQGLISVDTFCRTVLVFLLCTAIDFFHSKLTGNVTCEIYGFRNAYPYGFTFI